MPSIGNSRKAIQALRPRTMPPIGSSTSICGGVFTLLWCAATNSKTLLSYSRLNSLVYPLGGISSASLPCDLSMIAGVPPPSTIAQMGLFGGVMYAYCPGFSPLIAPSTLCAKLPAFSLRSGINTKFSPATKEGSKLVSPICKAGISPIATFTVAPPTRRIHIITTVRTKRQTNVRLISQANFDKAATCAGVASCEG